MNFWTRLFDRMPRSSSSRTTTARSHGLEMLESRALMAAPTIGTATFTSGATVLDDLTPLNRPAALTITIPVTANASPVSKVAVFVDKSNNNKVTSDDLFLGFAKKPTSGDNWVLTLKKTKDLPAGTVDSPKTVNLVIVASSEDVKVATNTTASFKSVGNIVPTAGKAKLTVLGPLQRNTGVAAGSYAFFDIRGRARDKDGDLSGYTYYWDINADGQLDAGDYKLNSKVRSDYTSFKLPATNGKTDLDLVNFPSSGTVSFFAVGVDRDGFTTAPIAGSRATVAAVAGPSINPVVTVVSNPTTKRTTLTVNNIVKGTNRLTAVSFFLDTTGKKVDGKYTGNGSFNVTDDLLRIGSLNSNTTSKSVTIATSKLIPGAKIFAIVVDSRGYTSNIAVYTPVVV